MHKTVGMGGRQCFNLPRLSAFGFRRGSDVGGVGAISSFSRVQKVTAAALSESEYVTLAEVVNELLTPPINDKIIIWEDN